MNSADKRNSVKLDYDLIAKEYCEDFGKEIEDIDVVEKFKSYLDSNIKKIEDIEVIEKFKSYLDNNSSILDLGGGSGKLTNYFINNGYSATCYDFSKNMMSIAHSYFPDIPYILDDIVNISNHYNNKSIDGIVALYSLFHIPKEDIKQLFIDINNVLKDNGLFCFSYQLGNGEMFIDEPYLGDEGKGVLYMNYMTKEELYDLLNTCGYGIIYEKDKHEEGKGVLGEDGNDAIYIIARKK